MFEKSARRTRRTHTPAFKAQVAMTALREDRTLAELAKHFELHSTQIVDWKRQLLEHAAEAFAARPGVCAGHNLHPYGERLVYLTAVVDVASRRVLAHRVAMTLEAIHAKEVIEQALAKYGTPEIVNTDRGGS